MGKREEKIANILKSGGFSVYHPPVISKDYFQKTKYHKQITEIYLKFGGLLDQYPSNIGAFDMVLENCFIELDEESHFNRYRKITLESPLYKNYKYFPIKEYQEFCEKNECKARTNGKFWTTKSSEKQFGESAEPNNFNGIGSARWKQRAFYDFLKDIYGLIENKPVFRISIFENIEGFLLDKMLKTATSDKLILEHFHKRFKILK